MSLVCTAYYIILSSSLKVHNELRKEWGTTWNMKVKYREKSGKIYMLRDNIKCMFSMFQGLGK